jgi:hypothetical protein
LVSSIFSRSPTKMIENWHVHWLYEL